MEEDRSKERELSSVVSVVSLTRRILRGSNGPTQTKKAQTLPEKENGRTTCQGSNTIEKELLEEVNWTIRWSVLVLKYTQKHLSEKCLQIT